MRTDEGLSKNQQIEIEIEGTNNLGYGISHDANGKIIFANNGVKGDRLLVQIIKVASSYYVAKTLRVLSPSPFRLETPACPVHASCGGCVYQHVLYSYELSAKQERIRNAFRKAGLPDVTVEEVLSTNQTCHYRNKAQYPVTMQNGKLQIGFYAAKTHRVVPSFSCSLQPDLFERIARSVCEFGDQMGWTAYDESTCTGELRHLYLRMGMKTGQIMVCLVVNGKGLKGENELFGRLKESFDGIRSLWINQNTDSTNVILGNKYRLLAGEKTIEDILCGKTIHLSPESFYQVNHDGAERLYQLAGQIAGLSKEDVLLDLYCGVGTIGLSLSDRVQRVIGIDIVPGAIENAKQNAKDNHIQNVSFYCGDAVSVSHLIQDIEKSNREVIQPTVIVLDPPRKGVSRDVIDFIEEKGIPKVVYVSCECETMARDVVLFMERGYRISSPVYGFDMFPRTGHVETVVLMSRSI
ncbi:MAG: 23S rRNA (uracil(1939)-C(5))-methyltransferase RlmD [Clostridia bacterium]|nr:23S rRNA (uracil(1939)-C(5))-methyltransferase RlmD [Clostridia bacterium]